MLHQPVTLGRIGAFGRALQRACARGVGGQAGCATGPHDAGQGRRVRWRHAGYQLAAIMPPISGTDHMRLLVAAHRRCHRILRHVRQRVGARIGRADAAFQRAPDQIRFAQVIQM